MFTGLSAFPLTPMNEQGIREDEFAALVSRLSAARVDSIGVLGSTGNYMYLSRQDRARAIQLAVENAGDVSNASQLSLASACGRELQLATGGLAKAPDGAIRRNVGPPLKRPPTVDLPTVMDR